MNEIWFWIKFFDSVVILILIIILFWCYYVLIIIMYFLVFVLSECYFCDYINNVN